MFFAIFGGIVYLTTAFKPGEKFSQIMSWKQQVSDLEIGIISQNPDQIKKIHEYIKCHDFDMDNIVFTLKAGRSIGRSYRTYSENDKLKMKISFFNIGDKREKLSKEFDDGFIYELKLSYRVSI